jgi:hypothetical protein
MGCLFGGLSLFCLLYLLAIGEREGLQMAGGEGFIANRRRLMDIFLQPPIHNVSYPISLL